MLNVSDSPEILTKVGDIAIYTFVTIKYIDIELYIYMICISKNTKSVIQKNIILYNTSFGAKDFSLKRHIEDDVREKT